MRFTIWGHSPDRIGCFLRKRENWSSQFSSSPDCIGCFFEERKTGVPREKPVREMMRTNNKLNAKMPSPVIEPELHWWEASALNTALSLQG